LLPWLAFTIKGL